MCALFSTLIGDADGLYDPQTYNDRLLRAFMNAPQIPNDKLMWYVIIHLTFVVSAVMMGILDKIAFSSQRDH
jgi:uncharacterized protein (TIGR00645 family)